MVKPALRTKSIGFKVREDEYAQLDAAAQTSGGSLGEWHGKKRSATAGVDADCRAPGDGDRLRSGT